MIQSQMWIPMKMKLAEDLEKEWVIPVLRNQHWCLVVVNMSKCSITLCDSVARQNVPPDGQLREWGDTVDACNATKDEEPCKQAEEEARWKKALEWILWKLLLPMLQMLVLTKESAKKEKATTPLNAKKARKREITSLPWVALFAAPLWTF